MHEEINTTQEKSPSGIIEDVNEILISVDLVFDGIVVINLCNVMKIGTCAKPL